MAVTGGYGQSGRYPAAVDRNMITAALTAVSGSSLDRRAGVLPVGELLEVIAGGNMYLQVKSGQCVLADGYVIQNSARYTLTLAAAGSTARTDLIIARMYDTEAGDATTGPEIEIVKGTTTAAPALPARSVPLATVAVGAGVAYVNSGDITSKRAYTASVGGPVRIDGAIDSPTLASGLVDGTLVWDSSAQLLAVKVGGAVTPIDPRGVNFGAMEAAQASAENLLDGVWKALAMTSTTHSRGSGLTVVTGATGGIQVSFTGRVRCHGEFALSSGAGRRSCAISVATPTIGVSSASRRNDSTGANAGGVQVFAADGEIDVSSGDVVKLWGLQFSGVTLVASDRRLQVERVA